MKDTPEIIGYRGIKNRITGEIVTQLAPGFRQDWPFGNLHPDQALGRYMDFWKFEDLMKTQELHFCRVDQYAKKDDPLEGALSPIGIHGKSASDMAFREVGVTQEAYAKQAEYRETAKACTFINCWHINRNESPLMWERYTTSNDSVLIITNAQRLAASLKQEVFGSSVKYVDLNTPRTEFGERSLFFYKDMSFAFEQEFRLLVDLMMLGGSIRHDHPDDFYRRMPVDVSRLVWGIQMHPNATSETKEKVGKLVSTHLPTAVEQPSSH
jgi:hypothetical protein